MFLITNMQLRDEMETLGLKIREARKQRGLLQADIAERASVRRQVTGELECGVYRGSLRKTLEVLRAMGLRLSIEPVRFPTLDELFMVIQCNLIVRFPRPCQCVCQVTAGRNSSLMILRP